MFFPLRKQERRIWFGSKKKCLYGLSDASRQFYLSVREEMLKLGCKQCVIEPSLFYKLSEEGKLEGLMVSHIDDFLHAGDSVFGEKIMDKFRDRFLAGKMEEDSFSYVGFRIQQNKQGILLDQGGYVDSVEVEWVDQGRLKQRQSELTAFEMTGYRSIVGAINWIVQGSRPDMAFELVELATRAGHATVDDLVRARKVLRRLQESESYILFPSIGFPWSMYVFTDASLGNLPDGISSSMGIVIFVFLYIHDGCQPTYWNI